MATSTLKPVTHRRIFHIAVPIVLSNATVPILGAVDTAVVWQSWRVGGHLCDAVYSRGEFGCALSKVRDVGGGRLGVSESALRVFVIAYASADQRGLLCVAPTSWRHAKSPIYAWQGLLKSTLKAIYQSHCPSPVLSYHTRVR